MKMINKRIFGTVMAAMCTVSGAAFIGNNSVYAEDVKTRMTVELGSGHEEAAGKWAEYLNDDTTGIYGSEAEASGSTVTFWYVPGFSDNYEEKMKEVYRKDGNEDKYKAPDEAAKNTLAYAQATVADNFLDFMATYGEPWKGDGDYGYTDNDEMSGSLSRRPFEEYTDWKTVNDESWYQNGQLEDYTPLPAETIFYGVWLKPIYNCDVRIEAPACGETNAGLFGDNTNPPSVYTSGEHYGVFVSKEGKSTDSWIKAGENGKYENDVFMGTFEGGKKYGAVIFIENDFGYYFADRANITIQGGTFMDMAKVPLNWDGDDNPYFDPDGMIMAAEVEVEHDWGEWVVTKEATETEEGEETRTCKGDPSHKETRTIPKIQSCGITVEPADITMTAEKGYKGDTVSRQITAESTGSEKVSFIMAGFKDTDSYEQFRISASEMNVRVSPVEGLPAGTYTCTVVIGDHDDRFDPVEVPVTFTVTAGNSESDDISSDGTDSNEEIGDPGTSGSEKSSTSGSSYTNTGSAVSAYPASSASNTYAQTPKTGDESSTLIWSLTAGASAAVLLFAVRRKARQR